MNLPREFSFTPKDYLFLSDLVTRRTGIVLGENKRDMVYARLSRRIRRLELSSFSKYVHILKGPDGESEIGFLINALTTNLTRFFREPQQFTHLREVAIPNCLEYLRAERSSRLRIWSAACSSGEEPYSIAMTICDSTGVEGLDARILATDLDTRMLETAVKGEYTEASVSDIPLEQRKNHLRSYESSGNDGWRVNEFVRSLVTFKQLNLIGEWPMHGPFDVIFCRNVMIYFDATTKQNLIQRFANIMRPGGWLYLGSSETMIDLGEDFERMGSTTYRRTS